MPITLEELRQRFPVRDCPPYGACIVVPGDEFNPDWEAELNFDRVDTDFGDPGKPFTLIPLKRKAEVRGNLRMPEWSNTDSARLLKRVAELPGSLESKCETLTKEFPGRSQAAIHQKYVKLQRLKKKTGEQEEKTTEAAWKDEEWKLLIQLWNTEPRLTLKEITKEFAKKFEERSETAIKDALGRLKRKGEIQSRHRTKRGKAELQKESEPKPSESTKMDLAKALAALVEAVGPENLQFSISIQIGSKAPPQ